MTINISGIYINNDKFAEINDINTSLNDVIINWSVNFSNQSSRQVSFDLRLGTHDIELGSDNYNPDVLKLDNSINNANFFRIKNHLLSRGITYYGQIKVKDNLNDSSSWQIFKFSVNKKPYIIAASISPGSPSSSEDLELLYTGSKEDINLDIIWYKNGIQQKHLNNFTSISREFTSSGDIWFCEIRPYDSIEYGKTFITDSVEIKQPLSSSVISVNNIEILPLNANDNDIIEARFSVINTLTQESIDQDFSLIKWYINDEEVLEAENSIFVRLNLKPGDKVKYEVTPSDGNVIGTSIVSDSITIKDSGFKVYNLRVNGLNENFSVTSTNPIVEWEVISPFNRVMRYAKIEIGTVPGANNIYSNVIKTFENIFTIPDNIIKKGGDYFITVSVSDNNSSFEGSSTSHFRLSGSIWESLVSNSVGWTIETASKVNGENGFGKIFISDGSRSAELRFYKDKVSLFLGSLEIIEAKINLEDFKSFIITGIGNDIKIYNNNNLIIDGSGKMNQESSEKFIEIGSYSEDEDFESLFKRVFYTTSGIYDPLSSTEYSKLKFYEYAQFTGQEISSITNFEGDVLFSSNPFDNSGSGKIYRIFENENQILTSIENIDNFDLEFSKIFSSPDYKRILFPHSKGLSYFNNYFITKYDINNLFNNGFNPILDKWEVIKSIPSPSTSYVSDGLVIDTTFSNTSSLYSENNVNQDAPSLLISFKNNSIDYFENKITVKVNNQDNSITFNIIDNESLLPNEYKFNFENYTLKEFVDNKLSNSLVNSDNGNTNHIASLLSFNIINNFESTMAYNLTTYSEQKDVLFNTFLFSQNVLNDNSEYLPYDDKYFSGGKYYITHRKKGTPWFDKVNNSKGWTIDISLAVDSTEDSNRKFISDDPDGVGLYFNDGSYKDCIYFLPQEIIIKNANTSVVYDTTDITDYRIVGKENGIKIFSKKTGDNKYTKIADAKMSSKATPEGSAGRPKIVSDNNGSLYSVWHDDGSYRRSLYFSEYHDGAGWSDPEQIVFDEFGSANPDLDIDSNGNIYVVFETKQSDYTDIAVVIKNDLGWSDPFILSSEKGDSLSPRIAIDDSDNIYVCWEDNRNGDPDIYLAKRTAIDGQWQSNNFGFSDIKITDSSDGAKNPDIITYNQDVYISWTSVRKSGNSIINVSFYNSFENKWYSSGQGENDITVSLVSARRADFSSIASSYSGDIIVVWHDVVGSNFQIFSRIINNYNTISDKPKQLTKGLYDSKFPSIGFNTVNNDFWVAFEREQNSPLTPYDSYFINENLLSSFDSKLYLVKYNSKNKIWESSNISTNIDGVDFGGFDVEIKSDNYGIYNRPFIPKNITSDNLHILHEYKTISNNELDINNSNYFTLVKDAVFDMSYNNYYNLSSNIFLIDSEYSDRHIDVSGINLRKEIRFGDFSDNIGTRFVLNKIRYYLNDAVEPFSIKLVSSATANIPRLKNQCVAANNFGDAWIGSEKGMFFLDGSNNNIFNFNNTDLNIKDLNIKDIAFDDNKNMFISTDVGTFVSHDHLYFTKIIGTNSDYEVSLPNSSNTVAIDSNGKLFIGSDSGLFVVNIDEIISKLKITSDSISSDRTVQVDNFEFYSTNDQKNTKKIINNIINCVKIDSNDVAWIGTNGGLIRYKNGDLIFFDNKNGLSSKKINDISIRNTAIRYLATPGGVFKMLGSRIDIVDLSNAVSTRSESLNNTVVGKLNVPTLNNARGVMWLEPNILFVTTKFNIYQITFLDEQFLSERIVISKFNSSDVSFINNNFSQNDDLKSFKLIGLDDIDIDENTVFEVFINGNKVDKGYEFNSKDKLIKFKYPIFKDDIVFVNVRNDIKLINDFTQNENEIFASGKKNTFAEKIVTNDNKIFVSTNGDVNSVLVNEDDESNRYPLDRIILDTSPPVGKITYVEQVDRTKVRLAIEKVNEAPFDNISGIDSLIVSNYSNFTSDGETSLDPVPFVNNIIHDLGNTFDNVTREFSFLLGSGSKIISFAPVGSNSRIFAGTSGPANIYAYSNENKQFELVSILDENNSDSSVDFMYVFNNSLIVGVGNESLNASIYSSSDGVNFNFIASLPSSRVHSAIELNGKLYIGTSNPEGKIFSFDGTSFEEIFSGISSSIFDMCISNESQENYIYAATGDSGRIYKLDIDNLTQQIIHSDSDELITSIDTISINGSNFIFAGTGSSAKIIRSLLPDEPFINSFKTINGSVNNIKNINGKLYATIDKVIYALENVWTSKYTNPLDILDITEGPDGDIWFVSSSSIHRFTEASDSKNIYLKLIDKAGNETSLFINEEQTELDPNLFTSVNIQDLIGFTNKNRILEVSDTGDTISTFDGDNYFYSSDKVDIEYGEYYSEIFNGTNSLVSWDSISWNAIILDNTSINIYVRSSDSKDDIESKDFDVVFDASAANEGDISFLSGQYIQFKIEMSSEQRNASPSLNRVTVKSLSSESTHLFTTNFILPSRLKSGILTSEKIIPFASDIIFGINTNNSVNFNDYQIIDENRIFTTNDDQFGDNIRIGVKFITPRKSNILTDTFGEYGPYDLPLSFNAVEWKYTNISDDMVNVNFRVSFYSDSSYTNEVYSTTSRIDPSGFFYDGSSFIPGGISIDPGDTVEFSFTPIGDNPLVCNQFYYVKVEINTVEDNIFEDFISNLTFVEACGVSFINNINFIFNNETSTGNFHFRIRFYDNEERTSLISTAFSGNDLQGWYADDDEIPSVGVFVSSGDSSNILYEASSNIDELERNTVYYLSIDVFDGSEFLFNSNTFTFRINDLSSDVYCGEYFDVPVLKNVGVMFELEGNELVKLGIN